MNSHDDTGPVRLEPHPADSRLGILRVERPPVNAFDQHMWDLFDRAAASLHGPTLYRSVVITGGPRHFAAGADVKELTSLSAEAGLELEADLIARCFASEDGQHGLGSFVDDGPGKAKFQGR